MVTIPHKMTLRIKKIATLLYLLTMNMDQVKKTMITEKNRIKKLLQLIIIRTRQSRPIRIVASRLKKIKKIRKKTTTTVTIATKENHYKTKGC
jgi:hypothetical protein